MELGKRSRHCSQNQPLRSLPRIRHPGRICPCVYSILSLPLAWQYKKMDKTSLNTMAGWGSCPLSPPHLHEAEGEERLRLPGRSGMESPAPVGDERGEGAVVQVRVQEGVGLTWHQKRRVGGTAGSGSVLEGGGGAKNWGGGLPWYQATPCSVMLSSGWIMAFQSTEGVCGPERRRCWEMPEAKAGLKGVQNASWSSRSKARRGKANAAQNGEPRSPRLSPATPEMCLTFSAQEGILPRAGETMHGGDNGTLGEAVGWEGGEDAPKKPRDAGREVFPPLLSPPRVLREPAGPQSPSRRPGFNGGASPGRLHQPDGVPQSLVEVTPQQPADGREVGEIPMAQVFCSRNGELQRGKKGRGGGKLPFPGFYFWRHVALTGRRDGPRQVDALQVLQLHVRAGGCHGEDADVGVASGVGELPGGVGDLGKGRECARRFHPCLIPARSLPEPAGLGCAYLQDCHRHVALPAAKPDVSKVDVPQRHVLRALPGCQRVGTAPIHRVQDSCPCPRRSWKKMVLIFHDPNEDLKTFTKRWDEWPATSGDGRAARESFPTVELGWGNGFWKLPAIPASLLLQDLRG